jgi:hypothetical protein
MVPVNETIGKYFSDVRDPRLELTRDHELMNILVLAICAIIGGADNWEDVEEFGNAKIEWFKTFLELPPGIPSHDTFGWVFARLNPEAFRQGFVNWVAGVCRVLPGQVIAIDGKKPHAARLQRWRDRTGSDRYGQRLASRKRIGAGADQSRQQIH